MGNIAIIQHFLFEFSAIITMLGDYDILIGELFDNPNVSQETKVAIKLVLFAIFILTLIINMRIMLSLLNL